jgi:hypothetical protein
MLKTVLPLGSFIINLYFVILYIYVGSDQRALCPLRGLARFQFPIPFPFVFPVAVCFLSSFRPYRPLPHCSEISGFS